MSKKEPWQNELETFLAETNSSVDIRVLARALASNESTEKMPDDETIEAIERALHIEQNLEAIGLQPMPEKLENTLKQIGQSEETTNVIWAQFATSWKKVTAVAATVTVAIVVGSVSFITPNQDPSLAEIQQAEQDLLIALQYVSIAQTKSSNRVAQAIDENVRFNFNRSLATPLNQVKESL